MNVKYLIASLLSSFLILSCRDSDEFYPLLDHTSSYVYVKEQKSCFALIKERDFCLFGQAPGVNKIEDDSTIISPDSGWVSLASVRGLKFKTVREVKNYFERKNFKFATLAEGVNYAATTSFLEAKEIAILGNTYIHEGKEYAAYIWYGFCRLNGDTVLSTKHISALDIDSKFDSEHNYLYLIKIK